jgi:hypothetical protein
MMISLRPVLCGAWGFMYFYSTQMLKLVGRKEITPD